MDMIQISLFPKVWSDKAIEADILRYRNNWKLPLLIDHVLDRFIVGWEPRIIETRAQFLESFVGLNREMARESYKWRCYLQGSRAENEKHIEDLQLEQGLLTAKYELEIFKADAELKVLRKDSEKAELKLKIAQAKKAIDDLGLSPESMEAAERELNTREKQVRDALDAVQADSGLSEEQQRRKRNILEERLVEIHDRQAQLL